MIYIFSANILLLFILAYYSAIIKNKYITFLIVIIFLLCASIFYGFRDIVIYNSNGYTTDTYRYALIWFKEIRTINDIFYGTSSWKADYLFFLIPYLTHFISDDPNIYLFINSFVSFSLLFIAYYRLVDKKDIFLFPLVIFLVLVSSTTVANYGNLLRQGLSISLVLLSLSLMLEKKYFYGYSILVLAVFSHKSALVFFIIYFFVFHFSFKLRTYYYALLLSVPFIFFNIVSYISNNLFLLSEKLITYQESHSRMLLFKSILLFLIAIFLFNFFKTRRYSKRFESVLKIYLFILLISFIFFKIEIISGRLLYYPSILLPYFIYYGINYIKQKNLYFVFLTLLSIMYAYLIFYASSTYETIRFSNIMI